MGNKNFISDDYPNLPNPLRSEHDKSGISDEVSFNFIDKDSAHLVSRRNKSSQNNSNGMVVVWQETF